jgi:molecular chaperone GrpE
VTAEKREAVESQPPVAEPKPVATEEREQVASSASPSQPTAPDVRQDEIENFRKRQRRLAEDRIEANRARLLRNFLMIADDLERALQVEGGADGSLRQGVELTMRSLKQLLKQEGVEPLRAKGETFDPTWHEAVGTVPHQKLGVDRDTIVDVTQQGYRLDGRLLRPARVIVAR